ncbi:DNA replication complex GINS protein PSF1 isoform X3 [Hydra vulgaris]|uniref:DNA replication complex GINS protein PSF1 n=2 Tax=Hydra vulgaris TaxID=6087 RepID=A0ABM4CKI5_HYDVU
MCGEMAFERIKELKRSTNGNLSMYNEDIIRQVLNEMRVLFEENQKEVAASVEGEEGLFSGVQLRHACLERNKRCLLAYIYNRMMHLKTLRWEIGSVLPAEIKINLCEQEIQWFATYSKMFTNYMMTVAGTGIDLTQNMVPPKSLFIEVRCLMDHGELVTEDGTVILLKKNSQHFLPTSQCEHLIRQGILEHITS